MLKTIKKTHLYSKQPFYYNDVTIERRIHIGDRITTTSMNANPNSFKDLNIDDCISKFKEQLKEEHVYRIPLSYFTNLGKINFLTKVDYRSKLHLEKEMKKLLEPRKVIASGTALPTPDAKIISTKAPYISLSKFY